MELKKIEYNFSVCKVEDLSAVDMSSKFCFVGKTDEEISLVCPTEDVPTQTLQREDGWNAFRIQGVLDFSLVGVLSQIAAILAAQKISIFAVSTYNTDYVLTKSGDYERALDLLQKAGYQIA